MPGRVLIVDDDKHTCELIEAMVTGQGLVADVASSVAEARQHCAAHRYHLLMVDQRLPDGNGLDFVKELDVSRTRQVAVLMTGFVDVRDAVSTIREGLFDYLAKPFESLDALEATLRRALAYDAALREADAFRQMLSQGGHAEALVGQSPAIQRLLAKVAQVAPLDTTVLIEGESGTGKELVARQLHRQSERNEQPFVAVNCGALTEELLESSLFGYERGAFTGAERTTPGFFEAAGGGTLFLDEIADMSPRLQAALLRVVEERSFKRLGSQALQRGDFRLICATNRPLSELVAAGQFREDLMWRLSVVTLETPPLRDRRSDIPLLASYFLDQLNQRYGRQTGPLTPEALEALERAPWRGNVRELRHVIERVVALQPLGSITERDLFEQPHVSALSSAKPQEMPLDYAAARQQFEARWLKQLMEAADGNVSAAARMSGLARQNLYTRLRRYQE
ncbi:sigma-54-dependent transcriptional regulator [Billgrantia kenyensis]|uniref:Sigma-54-dependent Fis family transcriptional regulator n=1 Tax=Billgrantia kenyensis TaxID=321266 RepID=A0A7V9VZK0_9GAMM|nr:sigma-54 dependent transcriptional regulator [Halomonas kenyensis]MBA2778324.1 sigma-54-dependent Fis family transcriptional regulator [Halomonas kenyensis]MCG6660631.1 sigma-54-dependent Fis family transcriptional regulator [Halomonas kenyensis]